MSKSNSVLGVEKGTARSIDRMLEMDAIIYVICYTFSSYFFLPSPANHRLFFAYAMRSCGPLMRSAFCSGSEIDLRTKANCMWSPSIDYLVRISVQGNFRYESPDESEVSFDGIRRICTITVYNLSRDRNFLLNSANPNSDRVLLSKVS